MKQVVILFGPPGAGKGTQSELLSEKLGLYLFETSKILEREFKKAEHLSPESPDRWVEVDGQKFDILAELDLWKRGILCSAPFVTYIVIEELKRLAADGDSLVLSGSPRTLYEVEHEMPVLEALYGKENIKIAMIEITPATTIFRNTHRKICELMRHSIFWSKETETLPICPIDGSKLVKRVGLDSPEVIRVRIEEYQKKTLPLFECFAKLGYTVHKIDGERSIAEVHASILEVIQ